jgi:hypothetical protein
VNKNKYTKKAFKVRAQHVFFACVVFCGTYGLYVYGPTLGSVVYSSTQQAFPFTEDGVVEKEEVFVATHMETPSAVKALYMSGCAAATPSFRSNLVTFIEETEINSVVIDVKDYSGRLSFTSEDAILAEAVSSECAVSDMKYFLASLHEKKIYTIARVTVFQDPYLTRTKPELAVKKNSDREAVWKDFKGLSFTDPGALPVWEYHVQIAKESYALGFDEINFDYIRYPSDGPMNDIYYPWSDGRQKTVVMGEFFKYLHDELSPLGIVMSADLFGMTTTNADDLNIGQKLEVALPYFDYIAPMVYPSHYPKGFLGFENPAAYPYEVIKHSMTEGVKKVQRFDATVASTSSLKLRPWIQDFNLGATYGADKVRAQIQATYDSGLTSWMLWNASNRYTKEALLAE